MIDHTCHIRKLFQIRQLCPTVELAEVWQLEVAHTSGVTQTTVISHARWLHGPTLDYASLIWIVAILGKLPY